MSKKFVVRGNTPPEMNFNSSKNIAEIQEFNNRQIYTKGFRQNTAVGTNNSYSFNLGGKARQLHGLIIIFPTASQNEDDLINFSLNSENIIENVNWRAYNPIVASGNGFKTEQYFTIRRALSGSDSCLMTVNAATSHSFDVIFYLSSK